MNYGGKTNIRTKVSGVNSQLTRWVEVEKFIFQLMDKIFYPFSCKGIDVKQA